MRPVVLLAVLLLLTGCGAVFSAASLTGWTDLSWHCGEALSATEGIGLRCGRLVFYNQAVEVRW